MNIAWPKDPDVVLAAAHVMLWWVLSAYLVFKTPKLLRWGAGLLVALTFIFLGLHAWPVAVIIVVGSLALWAVRGPLSHRRSAEGEISATLLVWIGTCLVLGHTGQGLARTVVDLPLPATRLAALCFGAAALVFAVWGGAAFVRGLLDELNTLPTVEHDSEDSDVDNEELRVGKLIGILERLFVFLTVGIGAYEAIGFLVAAKGLVRIKKFEQEHFAEYFLVGTLASVLFALVLGLLCRAAINVYWA